MQRIQHPVAAGGKPDCRRRSRGASGLGGQGAPGKTPIDAGATRVTVEIEAGGTRLMRVSDNGCGMSPDDAVACFGRHATSKLRSESDLAAVATLGFRGEALASVAAVSRVTLRTREPGSDEGFEVVMQGGELVSSSPCGCPVGTDIAVQDLFYNTRRAKNSSKRRAPRPPSSAACWKSWPSRGRGLPSPIKRTAGRAFAPRAPATCAKRRAPCWGSPWRAPCCRSPFRRAA